MENLHDIAEALRDAATAGGDVYSWEFDADSLTIESLEINRGRVSDITLEDDIEITRIDGENLRDVVIVNKEVFDQALAALDKLTSAPDPEVLGKISELGFALNQLRKKVGMPTLVSLEGSNNG
jgi:hypothetical protein